MKSECKSVFPAVGRPSRLVTETLHALIRLSSAYSRAFLLTVFVFMASPLAWSATGGALYSPFGKATPAQEKAAKAADVSRLNALAAWNHLPQKQRKILTARMLSLNNEQRTALLNTVPRLANLTPEKKQALLDNIALYAPLPATWDFSATVTMGAYDPGINAQQFHLAFSSVTLPSGTVSFTMFITVLDATGVSLVRYQTGGTAEDLLTYGLDTRVILDGATQCVKPLTIEITLNDPNNDNKLMVSKRYPIESVISCP